MKKLLSALFVSSFLASGSTAFAQDGFIDEARFALYSAQPEFIEQNHAEADQFAVGASLIFAPINIDLFGFSEGSDSGFVRALFNPRPHIGAVANLDSNGTSYGFIDLNWTFDITEAFFVEGGLGMAYTNASKTPKVDRAGLGAHWQFHETVSLGYRITPNMNVLFSFEHLSHRKLFSEQNRGLSNLSLKLGYSF